MNIHKAAELCPEKLEALLNICFEQAEKANGTFPQEGTLLTMSAMMRVCEFSYTAFLPIKNAVEDLMMCAEMKESLKRDTEQVMAVSHLETVEDNEE